MTSQSKQWRRAASLGLSLVVAGCTSSGTMAGSAAQYSALNMENQVIVNRDTVTIYPNRTVLDLLEGRVARFRFSLSMGRGPLVVLDDVPLVDGLSWLRQMQASDVESISTLWALDAVTRYGSAASDGAIVITTRHGRRFR